jgi:hypothetical protein
MATQIKRRNADGISDQIILFKATEYEQNKIYSPATHTKQMLTISMLFEYLLHFFQ